MHLVFMPKASSLCFVWSCKTTQLNFVQNVMPAKEPAQTVRDLLFASHSHYRIRFSEKKYSTKTDDKTFWSFTVYFNKSSSNPGVVKNKAKQVRNVFRNSLGLLADWKKGVNLNINDISMRGKHRE